MILSVHLWHVFSCNIYCKFYFTTLSCYYNSFGIYFSLNTYFQYSFAALSVAASKKKDPPHFCGRSPYSQLGSSACTNYFAMYLAET